MERYVILQADNIGKDIAMSKVYRSKEDALEGMRKAYHDIVDEPEYDIERSSGCEGNKFEVLFENGDFIYGEVKQIDTDSKPKTETPKLKACTVQELAEYYANLILEDSNFNKNIPDCDFAISEDYDENETLEERYDNASGWYGMKKLDAGFDNFDLSLVSDYYGGGSVMTTNLFEGMEKRHIAAEIERIILGTFNTTEVAFRDTELIVEFLENAQEEAE